MKDDEPIDWDLFFDYIELVFPSDKIKFHIKELFDLKGMIIKDDDLNKIEPIVSKFLKFLEKFKAFINSN